MKKKYSLILDDEFIQYCELNNIEDIEKLAKETFNKGFLQLKYGWSPKIDVDKVIIVPPVMVAENKSDPEPQKEEVRDTQIKSKIVTPLVTKNVSNRPEKDLYDE